MSADDPPNGLASLNDVMRQRTSHDVSSNRSNGVSTRHRVRALWIFAVLGICLFSACSSTGGAGQPQPPELPYEFGPAGHGESSSCVTPPTLPPPPAEPDPKGCISGYVIRPGLVTVTILTAGVAAADAVIATACKSNTCQQSSRRPQQVTPGSFATLTAEIPTAAVDGVTKLCGYITRLGVGQPPLHFIQLDCLPLTRPLRKAAGAFKATAGADGVILNGWATDVRTDQPGTFVMRNGTVSVSRRGEVTANIADARSLGPMPGFSDRHGFNAVIPYTGTPGPTSICVSLLRQPQLLRPVVPKVADVDGLAGAATEEQLACFAYDEPSEAFAPPHVAPGDPISVKVRNVGPGTKVNINLLSDGGYFLLPWEFETWATMAGPDGSADFVIDSSIAPAGDYTVAFNCQPGCPRVDVSGTPDWKGSVTLSSRLQVGASGGPSLTATKVASTKVYASGSGFTPGERLRLIAFPNLRYSDGPPVESAMVTYPVANAQGGFGLEVDLAGFPLSNTLTQFVAYNALERPVASFMYSSF